MWSNPRARAAVDCREVDGGDVREETVLGNACGGKPGSHGSKVIRLSHWTSVGGHPREVRWTVTPSERKDSDSSD